LDGLRVVFYVSAAPSILAAFASLARPERAAIAEAPDEIAEGAIAVSEDIAATSIIEEDEAASGATR
jgi:hypothetical protein